MFVVTGGWLIAGVLIVLIGGGLIIASAHMVASQSVARRLVQSVPQLVLAFGMALLIAYLWWYREWVNVAARIVSAKHSTAGQQLFTALEVFGIVQWFFASIGALFVFHAVGDFYRPAGTATDTTPRHGGLELIAGILLLLLAAIAGGFTVLVSIALSVSVAP